MRAIQGVDDLPGAHRQGWIIDGQWQAVSESVNISGAEKIKSAKKQIVKDFGVCADIALSPRNDPEHQTRSLVGGISALNVGLSRLPQPPVMGYKVA